MTSWDSLDSERTTSHIFNCFWIPSGIALHFNSALSYGDNQLGGYDGPKALAMYLHSKTITSVEDLGNSINCVQASIDVAEKITLLSNLVERHGRASCASQTWHDFRARVYKYGAHLNVDDTLH